MARDAGGLLVRPAAPGSASVIPSGSGHRLSLVTTSTEFPPSALVSCGAGADRVDEHVAVTLLGADCDRFTEASDGLQTNGSNADDFPGSLAFVRTAPGRLAVRAAEPCRSLRVRLRSRLSGRVLATRRLRGTRSTRFRLPRDVSTVEARGCGGDGWAVQARPQR